MAEQENPVVEEATANDAAQPTENATQQQVEAAEEQFSYPEPKGAFLFVMLMMIFYIAYWTISYFEIFIFRGA
jgi:hypothetical protein